MKTFICATKEFGNVKVTAEICKSKEPILLIFVYMPEYTGKMLKDFKRGYDRDRAYNGFTQVDADDAARRVARSTLAEVMNANAHRMGMYEPKRKPTGKTKPNEIQNRLF